MKTNMKNQKEIDKINYGLQSDLLKMIEDDSDDLEDTESTNNLNQSEGKENENLERGNLSFRCQMREFNFENLGKEFEIKKDVNNLLYFFKNL
jgi:hypothetical protein